MEIAHFSEFHHQKQDFYPHPIVWHKTKAQNWSFLHNLCLSPVWTEPNDTSMYSKVMKSGF